MGQKLAVPQDSGKLPTIKYVYNLNPSVSTPGLIALHFSRKRSEEEAKEDGEAAPVFAGIRYYKAGR